MVKFRTFFVTKIGMRSKGETKAAPNAPAEEAPKSKHKQSPNLTKGVKGG